MKTKDAKEKKFRQLSDEELEKVTGGAIIPGQHATVTCLESDGVTLMANASACQSPIHIDKE